MVNKNWSLKDQKAAWNELLDEELLEIETGHAKFELDQHRRRQDRDAAIAEANRLARKNGGRR